MAKDSAVRIEIGRSFHQLGTVQVKVRESDLVPLWDGTTRRRSLIAWERQWAIENHLLTKRVQETTDRDSI